MSDRGRIAAGCHQRCEPGRDQEAMLQRGPGKGDDRHPSAENGLRSLRDGYTRQLHMEGVVWT